MSQIILLFDLDQCLPLTNDGLTAEKLESFITRLRKVCLQILLGHSSTEGISNNLIGSERDSNRSKKKLASSYHLGHFSFRFYSSNEYFMVPDQFQPKFYEVGEETFDNLETILSERFERLIQDSKTNTYNADGLRQHIESESHKSHSQTLRKALEEIAVLYNWDNPMLHSPVKKVRGTSRGRIPSISTKDKNIVYVFTRLPNNNLELSKFLGKNPRHNKRYRHQDIFDEIFNQSQNQGTSHINTSTKKSLILNSFKNQDNPISLSVIDTASFYEKQENGIYSDKKNESFDKNVKHSFEKCFRNLNGTIISIGCFDSDLYQVKRKGEVLKRYDQYSVPLSSIFQTYSKESKDHTRRASFEKGKKEKTCKLILDKLGENNENAYPDIYLQWCCLDKGHYKQTLNNDKNTSIDTLEDDILTKQDLEILACMNNNMVPRAQKWDQHYSIWPKHGENNDRNINISYQIFRYIANNGKVLLLKMKSCELEAKTSRVCVITPFDMYSGILSVADENDSSYYSVLAKYSNFSSIASNQIELAKEMCNIIEDKLALCDNILPAIKTQKSFDSDASVFGFNANCFEPWKLPESTPFSQIITRVKDKKISESKEKRFRNLQKFCLPQNVNHAPEKDSTVLAKGGFYINEHKDKLLEMRLTQRLIHKNTTKSLNRLVSDESGITIGSRGSSGALRPGSHVGSSNISDPVSGKMLSRAGKMVKLVQKNEQLRRSSNDEKILVNKDIEQQQENKENLDKEKQRAMQLLEDEVKPVYDSLNPPTHIEDKNPLIEKLQRLQMDLIIKEDDISLVCLAEITVRYLANYLRDIRPAQTDKAVEDILSGCFLLSPADMQNSSFRTKLWEQFGGSRVRDHKLQVLYRVDVHWILSSQKIQNQIEDEILDHLRKIQLWGSINEMVSFLNDVLTPNYIDKSSDLLTFLYDEQSQKRPKELEMLFSPAKSDISSIAPSSVMSRTSELSYKSIPSLRARRCNGPNSGNLAGTTNNVSEMEKVKKLRRYTSFDTQTFQINMMDKKNLGRSAKLSVAGYNKVKNSSQNIGNIPKRTGRTPKKTSSQNLPNSTRAKRNLSFDEPNFGNISDSYASGLRRSPRKRISTCEIASLSGKPKQEVKTPRKSQSRGATTPCKMTPGKSHMLYAPETPKNKGQNRRKTDGVAYVAESPDIDQIKSKSGNTPRRIAASLKLRKKTSFYSGEVSRNLMKAEELINASQIQSFTNTSFAKHDTSRKSNIFAPSENEDSFNELERRRDSYGVLFPHLVQSNKQNAKELLQVSSEDLNKSDLEDKGLNQSDSLIENKTSDLRKDSGCPSDKFSNVGSNTSFASRKLFLENIPNSQIDKTSPKPSNIREIRKVALTPIAVGKNRLKIEENIHPAFIEGLEEFRSPRKKISLIHHQIPTSNKDDKCEDTPRSVIVSNSSENVLQNRVEPKSSSDHYQNGLQPPIKNEDIIEKNKFNMIESIAEALCKASEDIVAGSTSTKHKPEANDSDNVSLVKFEESIASNNVSLESKKVSSPSSHACVEGEINDMNKMKVNSDATCEMERTDKQVCTDVSTSEIRYVRPSRKRKRTSVTPEVEANDSVNQLSLNSKDNIRLKTVSVELDSVSSLSVPKLDKRTEKHDIRKDIADPDSICETENTDELACNDISTEEIKHEKPSRKRKLTSRLGIDDITLNEAIHSTPPRIRLTPKIRKPEVILKNVDSNSLLKQPIMQVTAADDAPIICDRHSTEKAPKRRKLFKQVDLELDKDDDSCCKKFNGSSCGYHETNNEVMDSKLKSETAVVILNKDEIDVNNSEKNINTSPDIKSPDKIWSVASRTESPKGEIKLCINRKKKPLVSKFIELLDI